MFKIYGGRWELIQDKIRDFRTLSRNLSLGLKCGMCFEIEDTSSIYKGENPR